MTFLAALMMAAGVGVLSYRFGVHRMRERVNRIVDFAAHLRAERDELREQLNLYRRSRVLAFEERCYQAADAAIYQFDRHADDEPTGPRVA